MKTKEQLGKRKVEQKQKRILRMSKHHCKYIQGQLEEEQELNDAAVQFAYEEFKRELEMLGLDIIN